MSRRKLIDTESKGDPQEIMKEQGHAGKSKKSVHQVSTSPKRQGQALSKTTPRYWETRIYKNSRTRDGKRAEDAAYSVKIQVAGRREVFPLGTGNQKLASKKAAAIFTEIKHGDGWSIALDRHKPKVQTEADGDFPSTVGGLIKASAALSSARPQTLNEYAKAMRKIASDIGGVNQSGKFLGVGKDAGVWQERVDQIPLDRLDRSTLLRWKNAYLRNAGDNAEAESAGVSFNSLRRNAKGLFPKKLRPYLADVIDLPEGFIEAFEELPMEEEPDLRYRSRIDADKILGKAEKSLAAPRRKKESEADAEARHEQYKALLLCLVFGLRRSEADMLLWSQLDLDKGVLHVESNRYHRLKSKKSAGDIELPPGIAKVLRGFKAKAKAEFILDSKNSPKSRGRRYRCDATFSHLLGWLRKNGVDEDKPIHTMRKEIGALIASQQGICAASRYLRHSDIGITARIYADQKEAVVAPLAAFGGGEEQNVERMEDAV